MVEKQMLPKMDKLKLAGAENTQTNKVSQVSLSTHAPPSQSRQLPATFILLWALIKSGFTCVYLQQVRGGL